MSNIIKNMVREAHKNITAATDPQDLGLVIEPDETYPIPDHWWSTDGISVRDCWFRNGTDLRKLREMDEGLFCHTVNKVAKWMREGKCPKGDVLCINTPGGYGKRTWFADKVVARYTLAME
jgi:hypothetical protein